MEHIIVLFILALCFFYGFQIEIKKFFMISPYTKM